MYSRGEKETAKLIPQVLQQSANAWASLSPAQRVREIIRQTPLIGLRGIAAFLGMSVEEFGSAMQADTDLQAAVNGHMQQKYDVPFDFSPTPKGYIPPSKKTENKIRKTEVKVLKKQSSAEQLHGQLAALIAEHADEPTWSLPTRAEMKASGYSAIDAVEAFKLLLADGLVVKRGTSYALPGKLEVAPCWGLLDGNNTLIFEDEAKAKEYLGNHGSGQMLQTWGLVK